MSRFVWEEGEIEISGTPATILWRVTVDGNSVGVFERNKDAEAFKAELLDDGIAENAILLSRVENLQKFDYN